MSYCCFWTYFTSFSSVSIVDFEQGNVYWPSLIKGIIDMNWVNSLNYFVIETICSCEGRTWYCPKICVLSWCKLSHFASSFLYITLKKIDQTQRRLSIANRNHYIGYHSTVYRPLIEKSAAVMLELSNAPTMKVFLNLFFF